ncbi:MAG: FHA domain-containing protein, partial [Thermoplasmata archaeon]|nr:FHA domain-containing protein [Thermoplasmata archaeon]
QVEMAINKFQVARMGGLLLEDLESGRSIFLDNTERNFGKKDFNWLSLYEMDLISRMAFRVFKSEKGYFIAHTSEGPPTNPVEVNGVEMRPGKQVRLEDGDLIDVTGVVTLRVHTRSVGNASLENLGLV